MKALLGKLDDVKAHPYGLKQKITFEWFILGYTDALRGLIRLGLLSPDQHPALHEQVDIMATK